MAKRRESKIIIDTNLWVSFLLTNEYSKLDSLFADRHIKLLFSQELLGEVIEVSQRPKFKKYFSSEDLDELLIQIGHHTEFIEVKENVTICRDPKDNFLLALAQASKATHLITGDKDLLSLKSFGRTKILTIASFLAEK
jgi:putative PIN family toxin of toxin-antitoxin system